MKNNNNSSISNLLYELYYNKLPKSSHSSGAFVNSYGLYKQANVSLRAELEMALRLVYFSTHRTEFKWWYEGKDYFGTRDVWGEKYSYFERLEKFKHFDRTIRSRNGQENTEQRGGSKLFNDISVLYNKLSRYVHSGVVSFQARGRLSPKYKTEEFNSWAGNFRDAQRYVNTILALGFSEEFERSGSSIQRKVLRAIGSGNYKKALRQSLHLRLRGGV